MSDFNGGIPRKYKFHWSLIGDLEEGRPNLGLSTRVEVYRLMQFTFRDVIESKYGTDAADEIFYAAGKIAGKEFYDRFISGAKTLSEFVKLMQDKMRDFNIGLLRVEEANDDASNLVLSVAEDLDCSGLPELEYEVCKYDEGFISGAVESFTGQPYDVKEIDCWCTGDRTCRFTVDKV
jgi:predicted hydrocarbon binding protein